ncbi:uncharacterized protein LOC116341233 [Contarinia nasturtii]|uniref:uncharacterized protein LOC116341233 n=1 Tax=Contarinia nasturtii TaxID=265458 RepID=UPI0012D4815A|nr:uncharacterized protein LOC116341233 [Contarinia nasturtii]
MLTKIQFRILFLATSVFSSFCGKNRESVAVYSPLPDLDQIYKPASFYVLNAQTDMKLTHDLHALKKSIGVVKKSLEHVKDDKIAAEILNFFQENLHHFETWIKNIMELGKATQTYVTVVGDHTRKLIENQKKDIMKMGAMLLGKLENLIKNHEKVASEQREDVDRTANLMHYEMVQQRKHLINIEKYLKGENIQSSSMDNFFKDLKPTLSLENILMKEVDHNMNLCNTAKNKMAMDVEKINRNRMRK